MILEKLLTTYTAKPNLIIFTRENQGKNPEAWKEKEAMIPQLQKESSKKVAPRCSEIFFSTILKFASLQRALGRYFVS